MNVTPDLIDKCTSGMANTGNQPSPADVDSVCNITGLDSAQATVLLRKWPGWQDAVTQYFENPSSALREDASHTTWEPQDNIPYANDMGMSRPPSPSRKFIDLRDAHAEATVLINNEQQKEEDDLNRAMAESIKEMQAQENGTTATNPQFGPAQRAYYNPADWAMTTVASSREVVDHPPPTKRRRVLGHPAFLRGSADTEYNAALLTIYHSIPLARQALLFPPLTIFSYGFNPEWWSGSTDENTKSLSLEPTDPGDEDRTRYLAEMQCLMAFLDHTTRAYGSVDALSDLRYCQYFRQESSFTKMLEAWQQAVMHEKPDDPLSQVFTTVAAQAPEMPGADPDTKDLFVICGPVKNAHTQADLLDKIVWADSGNQPMNDVWFEQLGHIVTMRIHNDAAGAAKLNLTPTEEWYLDRYTPELREQLKDMRQQCYALLKEKDQLTRAQRRLAEMGAVQPAAPPVNVRKALESAWEVLPLAADPSVRRETTLVDDSAHFEAHPIQSRIDHLLAQIDVNLHRLSDAKGALDSRIKEIMSDVMDPATSSQPLRHKYVLQGVSTKPQVTYVRKLNRDLIGLDEEEPHEIWQWWRTAWGEIADPASGPGIPPSAAPDADQDDLLNYSVQKVSRKEVLDAVKNEHHTAFLVYADATAMSVRPGPLPASLRQFVEQDNRAFEDEISRYHVQHSGRGRSWSNETNSTVMDDNPFDDGAFPAAARDATPMSTSTIRSCDGPPSPKRPRSSDESPATMASDDRPPAYEDVAGPSSREMVEQSRNKIGYLAEQFMHKVDEHESRQL